jgi:hypothetical protein
VSPDLAIAVPERLERSDFVALCGDQARHNDIEQERGGREKEDREHLPDVSSCAISSEMTRFDFWSSRPIAPTAP